MNKTDPTTGRCANCQLKQQELDLMARLVAAEQRSDQMKSDLIHAYDQLLTRIGADKRQVAQKAINVYANYNKLQKLRAELSQWQKLHKQSQPQATSTKEQINLEDGEVLETCLISCETQTKTQVPPIASQPQNVPKAHQNGPEPAKPVGTPVSTSDQNLVSVKLEVIPKEEPLSDDDCVIIEGVEPPPPPTTTSPPTANPTEFQFGSHLFFKRSEEESVSSDKPPDKTLAIDLNESDDTSGPSNYPIIGSTIFDNDEIIDLTPTKKTKKLGKKKVAKKKNVGQFKKKLVQTKKAIEKTAKHLRVIESNRKKIRINSDNTITILDVTPNLNKDKAESSTKKAKAVTKPELNDNLTNRQQSRIKNENYIKKNKNKIVLKDNMYYCKWKDCDYSTDTRSNAVRHLWKHNGEAPFACRICGQGFRDKRNMCAHVMMHNAHGHTVCPACDKSYESFANLMKHVKNMHGLDKADKWKKEYLKQKSLMEVGVKVKETSKVIKTVKKPVVKVARAAVQLPRTPAPGPDEWQCDFPNCNRVYSGKHNLKRHQFDIHKKLSRPLFKGHLTKCDNVKFFVPKASNSSPRAVVTPSVVKPVPSVQSAKNVVCNHCSKDFYSLSGLHKHKKKFHSIAPVRGQAMTSMSSKAYDKNKPWACTQCPARYNCKGTLTRHINSEHNADNENVEEDSDDYPCPYENCDHIAQTRKGQLIHWKTHFSDEDKPFKCLIAGCSYSNKELSKLKNHVWNKHSEQQFFKAMEETGIHYPIWY